MASSSIRSAVASASRSAYIPKAPSVLLPNRRYATETPTPAASVSSTETWNYPEIHLGPTHPNRYREHYENTLETDLMYMTYDHKLARKAPRVEPEPPLLNPYEANRPQPWYKNTRPRAKALDPGSIPKIERIVLHTYVKEAIGNKQNLLPAIQALRAISGESVSGGGRAGSTGVQIILAKNSAANWRLREGMPIGAKVEMKGDAMYDFIQSLVDFVLPRIREYPGAPLPPASASGLKTNALSGVVSFGFPHTAMALFPQIEANLDSWGKLYGFHVYFITNQRGQNAEAVARSVLSGFRVPFYRK